MNLQQLNTLYINEGTEKTPFILTEREVDTLYRISLQADAEKHNVEGWVNTESGAMPSYIKHQLEKKFPNLHVISNGSSSQDWTVDFASHSINEGGETRIVAINLAADSLSYSVLLKSLQVTKGIYSETQAKDHMHIDLESSRIYYDAPTSDAGWIASFTVRFWPAFIESPTAEDYRDVNIDVVAVPVSSIEIQSAEEVILNSNTNVVLKALPENNTKRSTTHSIMLSVLGGGYIAPNKIEGLEGTVKYYAQSANENVTIFAELHLFGASATYAAAQKDIKVGIPYIEARITGVDDEDVKLTIISREGIRTELRNGERMTVSGNGIDEYTIEADKVQGYRAKYTKKIIPNQVETLAEVTYEVIQPDVFIVYDDGTAESYQEVKEKYYAVDTDRAVGVALVTSTCSFLLSKRENEETSGLQWSTVNILIPGLFTTDDATQARNNFDGEKNTKTVLDFFKKNNGEPRSLNYCYNKTITIAGEEVHGYLPSIGEMIALGENQDKINELFKNALFRNYVINIKSRWWQSSVQRDADNIWEYGNGTVNTRGKYGIYQVMPFYPFNLE